MNRSYDEYNYTLSKRELEELKFLFISDDVDYNDTDSNGLTFLLTAIESADLVEQDGVLKPDKRSVDFIKWLIAQGSDVNFPADKSLYNMLSNVKRKYLAVKARPAICQKFFCFSVKAVLTAPVLTSLLTADSPLV